MPPYKSANIAYTGRCKWIISILDEQFHAGWIYPHDRLARHPRPDDCHACPYGLCHLDDGEDTRTLQRRRGSRNRQRPVRGIVQGERFRFRATHCWVLFLSILKFNATPELYRPPCASVNRGPPIAS